MLVDYEGPFRHPTWWIGFGRRCLAMRKKTTDPWSCNSERKFLQLEGDLPNFYIRFEFFDIYVPRDGAVQECPAT